MPIEVVLIAISGMVALLVMIHMINKATLDHERAKAAGKIDTETVHRLLADNAAEISRLRARVEVLERLATDEDRKLSGEIDRLRAQPRA